MQASAWRYGYTIPERPYFEQATSRFVSQGRRTQFIVTSDSMEWVKRTINFTSIAQQFSQTKNEINVVYSEGNDAGFDLGLLSQCDGVIISTNSYGWWGAWLANKTTIYYSDWPRTGSLLQSQVISSDYFPPSWIPIGGPAFRFG